MKQLTFLFVIVISCIQCFSQEKNNFEKKVQLSVEQYLKIYPQSTLKDLYKNFFQDTYGPRHIVNDTLAAKNYLLNELNSYTEAVGIMAEPTGWQHNFHRVNLSVIKNNIIPFDTFFEAFIQSANNTKPININDWKKEWLGIETIIRSMQLSLPNYEQDYNEIKIRLEEGKYIGHHSELFREIYKPHYRIISTPIYKLKLLPLLKIHMEKQTDKR